MLFSCRRWLAIAVLCGAAPFGQSLWAGETASASPAGQDLTLVITDIQLDNGCRISFQTQVGWTYEVEFADVFHQWQVLQSGIIGNGNPTSVDDANLESQGLHRFYRVRATKQWTPNTTSFTWIPPGTFMMGSPTSEPNRDIEEDQHTVSIRRGFWMGKHLVTQQEYLAVMGSNPSTFSGDLQRPVERVSWFDATNYCGKLTLQEQLAGRLPPGYEYRLPTEAQWEYACRAGTTTATTFGDSLSSSQANFYGKYPYNGGATGPYLGQTTKVGSYTPNGWGLYDMHGNAWEWCSDWYGSYPTGSVTDPTGPVSGSLRVIRGGCWFSLGRDCRSADRNWSEPGIRANSVGFRVVVVAVP